MADEQDFAELRQALLGLNPRTWKGYPVQPNGLPDLSGVPFFGEQGAGELARKVGPGIAMDAATIAAPGIGRAIAAAPRTAGAAAAALGLGTPTEAANTAGNKDYNGPSLLQELMSILP